VAPPSPQLFFHFSIFFVLHFFLESQLIHPKIVPLHFLVLIVLLEVIEFVHVDRLEPLLYRLDCLLLALEFSLQISFVLFIVSHVSGYKFLVLLYIFNELFILFFPSFGAGLDFFNFLLDFVNFPFSQPLHSEFHFYLLLLLLALLDLLPVFLKFFELFVPLLLLFLQLGEMSLNGDFLLRVGAVIVKEHFGCNIFVLLYQFGDGQLDLFLRLVDASNCCFFLIRLAGQRRGRRLVVLTLAHLVLFLFALLVFLFPLLALLVALLLLFVLVLLTRFFLFLALFVFLANILILFVLAFLRALLDRWLSFDAIG
jgi:hypothetical protein